MKFKAVSIVLGWTSVAGNQFSTCVNRIRPGDGNGNEFDYGEIPSHVSVGRYPSAQ